MKPGFFSAHHAHTWITQHYNRVIQMLHQQVENTHTALWGVRYSLMNSVPIAREVKGTMLSHRWPVIEELGSQRLKSNIPRYRTKNKCGQEIFVFWHIFKGQGGTLSRTKGGSAKGEKKTHKYQRSYFSKYGPSTISITITGLLAKNSKVQNLTMLLKSHFMGRVRELHFKPPPRMMLKHISV